MENIVKEIKLYDMQLDHIDKILGIETLSFSIPWSRDSFEYEVSKNNLAEYIIAKSDDEIVGYAGMWKIIDEGHITNIAVHPDHRSKKVGTTMVQGLIDLAKKNGLERLTLEVRKSNVLAQNLYKKFGFQEAGVRKKYYGDNKEDAIIMWKVIN